MRMGMKCFSILTLLGVLWTSPVCADEITEQIKEGLQLYEKGDYAEAVSALNYAVGQIQQEQASALKKIFPEPLQGWKANDAEGEFAPAVLLGGGVTASRHYYVEEGEKTIDIEFVSNSPMVQPILMLLSNPAFIGQEPGSKLTKVKGYKAVQKFSAQDKYGEISLVIQSKMLVTLKGSGIESVDDLMAYADVIHYEGLEKFLGNAKAE